MRFLIRLVVLLPMMLAFDALAQTPVETRGGVHDGYGRLVFSWPQPVVFEARIEGNELVVEFTQPLSSNLAPAVRLLRQYISDGRIAGRQARFTLTRPVDIRSFGSGSSVVVDVVNPPGTTAPAAGGRTGSPATPLVPVRTGEHERYSRVVFDWPRTIDYSVDQQGNRVVVKFSAPGRIDAAALARSLPKNISSVSAAAGGSLSVTLNVAEGIRLRHFRSGPKIVVDVISGAGEPEEPAPRVASRPPADAVPASPPAPAPVAAPPAPAAEKPAPAGAPVVLVPRKPADTEPAAPAAPAIAPVAPVPEQPVATGPSVSLSFEWRDPAAASIFMRNGFLWVVFDRRREFDLALLKRLGGDVATDIQQLPGERGSAVRMSIPPGYAPQVRKDGLLWIVDVAPGILKPQQPIAVVPQVGLASGSRILLPVPEPAPPVQFVDPDVGDRITAIPVVPLGSGVVQMRELRDMRILPSVQGIALIPYADDLIVQPTRTGAVITRPSGLALSVENKQVEGESLGGTGNASRIFDLPVWVGNGSFLGNKQRLFNAVATSRGSQRDPARLELARFYFANGLGAETLGVLALMAESDPEILSDPAFRALRGGARLLNNNLPGAREDLFHERLDGVDEIELWRGAVLAREGDLQRAGLPMRSGGAILADYPETVKRKLALLGAEATLALGDAKSAEEFLRMLEQDNPTPRDEAKVQRLQGALAELTGDYEEAIAKWEKVENGPDRYARSRAALARIELLFRTDEINAGKATEELEKLRFVWRGDAFEFQLLRRMGDFYLEAGNYRQALETYKSLVSNFPSKPESKAVTQLMKDIFENLYLNDAADAIPPVTAISLYNEFRELTPGGERGDELIRKLADRLVGVDLLPQAARILRDQVETRLTGVEKARVGTRLALIQLLDRKPDATVRALDDSESENMPEELVEQRRHIRARAQIEQDNFEGALVTLADDGSKDANLLRAEAYTEMKDWRRSAVIFGRLVGPIDRRGEISPETAQYAMNWAIALALAADEEKLRDLRTRLGDAMNKTELAEAFQLITSAASEGLIDYRTIQNQVKDVEQFQAFMTNYRDRLKGGGLSAIN
ncbi:MAG: tetratricopeptide repeat protein [Rhodospirillales bacterium]